MLFGKERMGYAGGHHNGLISSDDKILFANGHSGLAIQDLNHRITRGGVGADPLALSEGKEGKTDCFTLG